MDCEVQVDSAPPQLMEMTEGLFVVSWIARGDGVEKSRVRVRAEIHGNSRLRRDRARHLDVEHHLAVRAVRIAGRAVGRMIDGHRSDRRRGYVETAEIGAEVRGPIAPAQLDERDALTGAGSFRITVKSGHLRRCVGHRRGARPTVNVARSGPASKARPGLRAVVEPQDGLDHTVPLGGQVDSARPSAVGAAGIGHVM